MVSLYGWLRRHPMLGDAVLAGLLAIQGVTSGVSRGGAPGPATGPIAGGRFAGIPVLVALALALTVLFRRRHPAGAFATGVAVGAAQVLTGLRPTMTDLAIVVLLYTLAAYKPRNLSIPGLMVCLAGSGAAVARWVPGSLSLMDWILAGSVLFAGPALFAWVLGDSMRCRRAYYASLEERAARLEWERDAQAQIAAAAERARIARELHDVVAHNVSVMVVQADGASYALRRDPARAAEALTAISATGRQALAEMRRLLGVLRRADEGPGRAPLPGIGQLDELLDHSRAAGLPVTFSVDGVPQQLPDGAALAAYRIVQESLTNARKHAGPRASAHVALRYLDDTLMLQITDDGEGAAAASDGGGHGLAGMRERVAVYGGSVEARPRPEGGFQVTARLPVAAAQAGAA